jgi:hypothetical protein
MTTTGGKPDWREESGRRLELLDEYAEFVIKLLDERTNAKADALLASDDTFRPLVQAVQRCREWSDFDQLVDELRSIPPPPNLERANDWLQARKTWIEARNVYGERQYSDRAEAVLRLVQQEVP